MGPFSKVFCGRCTALITTSGKLCMFGELISHDSHMIRILYILIICKLTETDPVIDTARYIDFPNEPDDCKVVDVAFADQYILCVTSTGNVYSWGKNTGYTIQVGKRRDHQYQY